MFKIGKIRTPPVRYFVRKVIKYQNVNKDKNLRQITTELFLDKYLFYFKKNKKYTKHYKKIKGKDGYDIIYQLLRLYVKRYKKNWYDLENEISSVIIFFNNYLKKI
jgi:hypothetical protein